MILSFWKKRDIMNLSFRKEGNGIVILSFWKEVSVITVSFRKESDSFRCDSTIAKPL